MEATLALAWMLAGLATAVAAGLALAWRSQRDRCSTLEGEARELRDALEAERAQLQRRARSGEDRTRELKELRARLEKTKKRAFASQEAAAPLQSRIRELEEGLASGERKLRALRLETEHLRQRSQARERETAELRQRLAGLEGRSLDPQQAATLTRRVEVAEAEVAALGEKLRLAERETRRYRTRERTHRRLYHVIKGELDVAKDRLRAIERAAPVPERLPGNAVEVEAAPRVPSPSSSGEG
jgi:chromosome segregation ATPase